jgi:hypothetical protein
MDPARLQIAAAAALLLGSLLVGVGHRGYSFRPWKRQIAAVPEALRRLADEPRVLVQSGLFPHAGYDERFQMLTPETLRDPENAGVAMLLARPDRRLSVPAGGHRRAPRAGADPYDSRGPHRRAASRRRYHTARISRPLCDGPWRAATTGPG